MSSSPLAQAITVLEDAAFQPADFADAMERAARPLGFDHFCMVYSDLQKLEFVAAAHAADGLEVYAREGWIEADYRARTVGLVGPDRLYVDHLVVPEEDRLRTTIFHDLYVPKRMAWFAGWQSNLAGADWIFSLARGREHGPVRPEEAETITTFMPHARRTALMARAVREARASGMAEGLAAAGHPSIVLDDAGRTVLVTPAASALFGHDFGVRNGVLWARDPASMKQVARLTAAASGRLDDVVLEPAVIRREDGRKPVSMQPLPVRGLGLDLLPGARLVLLLIDLDRKGGAAAADLMRLFDLSPAEAEVATRLAAGDTLAQIADGRKVALETVRVQLKGVLRKMDASRQSDVVRIVDRLFRHSRGG